MLHHKERNTLWEIVKLDIKERNTLWEIVKLDIGIEIKITVVIKYAG